MGLRTRQVSGDWGHQSSDLLQSGPPEIPKPQQSEPLKCPRCSSINTKFCYYNNYNKSQPRHFCKSCKRHWTKGGTLRNVPVGGCRKNKRPKISSAAPNFTSPPANRNKGASSNIFYQTLIRSSSSNPASGIKAGKDLMASNNISMDQNPNSEFEFSSSIFPTTCYINSIGNIDSIEDSSVTTVNTDYPNSSSSGGWLGFEFDTSNCSMELPGNYWNWSEMDTSAEELNLLSWEVEDVDVINGETKIVKP